MPSGKALNVVRGGRFNDAQYLREASSLPPTGTVQIGKIRVKGGLSEQAVRDVVGKRLADMGAHYGAGLANQPGLKGKMVIEFVVQADGTVHDVKVTSNQLTEDLEKRLVTLFGQFAFPPPTGGEATVTVTLNFKP